MARWNTCRTPFLLNRVGAGKESAALRDPPGDGIDRTIANCVSYTLN